MRATCTAVDSRSTRGAVQTVSDADASVLDEIADVQTDIAANKLDDRWFSRIARALFPVKAGMTLHLLTDVNERSCHRYAAGERIPDATFFAKILLSDTGLSLMRRFMAGRAPQWWEDVEDALELLETVRATTASRQRRA